MYLNYIEIEKLKKELNKVTAGAPGELNQNSDLIDDANYYQDSLEDQREKHEGCFFDDLESADDCLEPPYHDTLRYIAEYPELSHDQDCPRLSPISEVSGDRIFEEYEGPVSAHEEEHSLCQKIYKIGALKGTSCTIPVINGATYCHKHKNN